MLREERGMTFAVGAMIRGLEVGGRWERIGVESAHELRWNAEVELVGALNITRIAQIVRVVGPERKVKKRGTFGIHLHVFLKGGIDIQRGKCRSWQWLGRQKERKVDSTHCEVVIDGEIDTGWRARG
jgi:hypothetical protein